MTLRSAVFVLGLIIAAAPTDSDAARILGYFPSPSKSHLIIHCAIADVLAQAGHNVTVIAHVPNVYKHAKYEYLHVAAITMDNSLANEMINKPEPIYKRFLSLTGLITKMANDSMSHPTMQQFLRTHGAGSFDLLILGYFMNDFQLGLAAHFDCPVVISFMIQPIFGVNAFIGNPAEMSYVPTVFSGLKQPMSFFDRVKSFLGSVFEQTVMDILIRSCNQELYDLHFPADRYPTMEALKKNISLVFSNHHFSQGPIRPHVPALVEIGGIQIKEQPSPLPADLRELLDNAKDGVIYFSFGSNVDGALLRKDKAKLMYDVLAQLSPYKVLWKWGDNADYPGTAANIIYKSWLPQDDILAHPNVKLFITHAGQGSIVESQYHGVPMVGIPLFGDQPANIGNVVRNGFGLSLDYLTLTAEDFRATLLEVLHNRKYADAVKKFSALYRDRALTPRQLVVFWTDYVLRHKGAPHLQSPAVHMNRWQLLSLDVIGFLVACLTLALIVVVLLCRKVTKLCKNCLRRKAAPSPKVKKTAPKAKKNK